jgi:hypothetical protein
LFPSQAGTKTRAKLTTKRAAAFPHTAFFATIHTFAHYINYISKPKAVETAFEVARWYGIPGALLGNATYL